VGHTFGPEWYHRVIRAHANCLENLPIFTLIVLVNKAFGASLYLLHLTSPRLCILMTIDHAHIYRW
jgi:uncharacterized membrane protein YecN with MAPEG domain